MNQMTVVDGTMINRTFQKQALDNGSYRESYKTSGVSNLSDILDFACLSLNINSAAEEEINHETNAIVFAGSKTEIALLNMTKSLGKLYKEDRSKTTITEIYPFSSEAKMMATVILYPVADNMRSWFDSTGETNKSPSQHVIFFKGAAEIIIRACNRYVDKDGSIKAIDDAYQQVLDSILKGFTEKALRTICSAFKPVDRAPNQEQPDKVAEKDSKGLILLGIFGIQDPLRPEVADAVKICQKAGIMIRMVTGDNAETARAIAKSCGILKDDGIVMEGPKFRALSPAEMREIAPKLQVLARSSPLDKQVLVNLLKKSGETVAVTGGTFRKEEII